MGELGVALRDTSRVDIVTGRQPPESLDMKSSPTPLLYLSFCVFSFALVDVKLAFNAQVIKLWTWGCDFKLLCA